MCLSKDCVTARSVGISNKVLLLYSDFLMLILVRNPKFCRLVVLVLSVQIYSLLLTLPAGDSVLCLLNEIKDDE